MRFVLVVVLALLPGCPKSEEPDGGTTDGDADADTDTDADADGDADERDAAPDAQHRPDGGAGFLLGSWQLQLAALVYEPNYPGAPSAPLRTCEGEVIQVVAPAFAEELAAERRGYLEDGRVIQEVGTLKAGGPCYAVMDPGTAPWGIGSYSRPLEPFRSVFVDGELAGDGRWLYVPVLDGKQMPGEERGLSLLHDGCVRVDDAGATGELFELWAVFPSYGDDIETLVGDEPVEVYQDSLYCER